MSVGALAIVHEYGAPSQNIPARPTHRPAIVAAKELISRKNESIARKAIKGASVLSEANALAFALAEALRASMRAIKTPALAPRTIAKRRAAGDSDPTDPLIFTRQLHDSITGKVTGG
jgi:hypothetical protein